jgi:hypothetical protein
MFVYLIELVIIALVIHQVAMPLLLGTPILPFLREKPLRDELSEVKQQVKEQEIKDEVFKIKRELKLKGRK